jgi:type IV pilus assembly protein PilM
MEVPLDIRHDSEGRLDFFSHALRELWSRGNFRGRRIVLGLPAASMHIQHLRLPRMDDASLCKAIPWELEGKLSIDPAKALIRHVVAGEINHEKQSASEVIVLAAERQVVEQLLAAASKARLDVAGINVESKAILDCFLNIYRRKTDSAVTNYFVDIGSAGTRATIARSGQILFARAIPFGGIQFNEAAARELNVTPEEARKLRIKLADDERRGTVIEDSAGTTLRKTPCEPEAQALALDSQNGGKACVVCPEPDLVATGVQIARAIAAPLDRLVEELALCRRYHEATFPDRPAQRLIFVGGEARQRALCTTIAQRLGIAAQVGDPLVRMARTTEVGIESGIDRRMPQPAWAVAIGLSMGTPGTEPGNGNPL